MCLRKVFPHEVRNLLSFKQHTEVGPDGKAKYLLPEEGQPSNLPRIFGGIAKDSDDGHKSSASPKHWSEGWYLSAGHGKWVVLERTEMMMLDLKQQKKLEAMRQSRKEVWQDYQDKLKQNIGEESQAGTPPPAWWGPLVRPNSSSPDK